MDYPMNGCLIKSCLGLSSDDHLLLSNENTKNCLNLPPFGTEEFIQITTTFVTAEFIQITRCVFNKIITYFLQIFILARVSAGGRQFLYFAKK